MAVDIETLDGLERKIILSLSLEEIQNEVATRLRGTQKKVRLNGFRPGKTPLRMVDQMYGDSIRQQVLNDKAVHSFYDILEKENIPLAGLKKLEALDAKEGQKEVLQVAAIFEVLPEKIDLGNLAQQEIEKIVSDVTDKDVDKTIDVLRRQRATYKEVNRPIKENDKVTLDFTGRIDGETFPEGNAENYKFILGRKQMLPEFEEGIIGMKKGETQEVDVTFPDPYHNKELAGKKAVFKITVHKVEEEELPTIDADFAKSLGIESGDIKEMKKEIKENLKREVSRRVDDLNREKVIELLLTSATFPIPQIMVSKEAERLLENAKKNLLKQGVKKESLPELSLEMFKGQAEKSVKVGLILRDFMDKEALTATDEETQALIEEMAQSYEDPKEVKKYYLRNKQEYATMKSLATEKNIIKYVLKQVKNKEIKKDFDQLMSMR